MLFGLRVSMSIADQIRPTNFLFSEYDNSSVGEEEHFEMRHLKMAISDWQVNNVSSLPCADTDKFDNRSGSIS